MKLCHHGLQALGPMQNCDQFEYIRLNLTQRGQAIFRFSTKWRVYSGKQILSGKTVFSSSPYDRFNTPLGWRIWSIPTAAVTSTKRSFLSAVRAGSSSRRSLSPLSRAVYILSKSFNQYFPSWKYRCWQFLKICFFVSRFYRYWSSQRTNGCRAVCRSYPYTMMM